MYYSTEGCASISDPSGNLLFYTQGDSVFDATGGMMVNGFEIGNTTSEWASSTQAALIVPQPGSADIHYIFSVDCAEAYLARGSRYSVVDMSLNGGLGEVVSKANLLHYPVTEKLAAVHHANGVDIWVMVHEHGSDAFMAYLVTANGISAQPVVSNVGFTQILPTDPYCMARGSMKFSPDGQSLVVLSYSDCHSWVTHPQLFHFDDATGDVTLNYTIEDPDSLMYYGASFSPNSELLYFSGGWWGLPVLHQFDATGSNSAGFLSSKYAIVDPADFDPLTSYWIYALQLAPTGELYICTEPDTSLDVIHEPDLAGAACGYQQHAVTMRGCTTPVFGLPNFVESYFRTTIVGGTCPPDSIEADFIFGTATGQICAGDTVLFTDLSTSYPENVGRWYWHFDDVLSGSNNSSVLQEPVHAFTLPGIYTVTLIAGIDRFGFGCKSDTVTIDIVVLNCNIGIDEIASSGFLVSGPQDLIDMHRQVCPQGCPEFAVVDGLGRLVVDGAGIEGSDSWFAEAAPGIYGFRARSGAEVRSGRILLIR